MATDNGQTTLSIKDSANKITTTNVNSEIPTAANYVALLAARDAWIGTMESLILGSIQASNMMVHKNFGNGLPAGDDAVRSKKFIFHMRDNINGEPYHFTIGTVKDFDGVDLKRAGNTNEVDITTDWWTQAAENGSLGISRIGAINAFVRSPEASHDGTLEQVFLMD